MSKQNQEIGDDNQPRLVYSIAQSYSDPMKQDIQSFQSSLYKSRNQIPYFRIENLQNLTEKERESLIQVIKKLQHKIAIEFKQNGQKSEINIKKKQNLPDSPIVKKQKSLYPSLQVQDPKALSNQFKVELLKNLLQKKSAQTVEMSKKMRQLEFKIEEMNIEIRSRQEFMHQETTNKILIDSFKQEVNNMVKVKIDDWQIQNQKLQSQYKLQSQQLCQKFSNLQTEYQYQITTLKNKLKDQSKKIKQLQDQIQSKNKQMQQISSKNQTLEFELSMKIRQGEAYQFQKQNFEKTIEKLQEKIFHFQRQFAEIQQRHSIQISQLKCSQQQQIQFYSTKLTNYEIELSNQKTYRQKDAQMILKLQEKIKQFEKTSLRTHHQFEQTQNQKDRNLAESQKKLKQYMKQLNKFQTEKQAMMSKKEQLYKENLLNKENIKQLTDQRQKLKDQLQQFKSTIQHRSQKIHILQIEIKEFKNTNKDIQIQRQMLTAEVQSYKSNFKAKDERIKILQEKNEKMYQQLHKKKEEYQVLLDKAQIHNNLTEKLQKSEQENKQKTHKLKLLQQQKDKLQTSFKKEMIMKASHFEDQLKKIKIEKDKYQHKLQQQVKKYNTLYQESKKIKLGSCTQDDKILQLKKMIQKYQGDIEYKEYRLKNQNLKFEEKMRIKQYELTQKNTKIEQLLQIITQMQQRQRNFQQSQTKQSRLNLFFELLKGFKSKMPTHELNSLRSKIGFLMN